MIRSTIASKASLACPVSGPRKRTRDLFLLGVLIFMAAPGRAQIIRFDTLPPPGKFLSTYLEHGMRITTRDCAEATRRDSLGLHDMSEPRCQLFLTDRGGNVALRASEAGNSQYLFSLDGDPFDLVGFDIVGLYGTGELVASSGAKTTFSSLRAPYGRFKLGNRPEPYHQAVEGTEWKGITWFVFRDGGGGATIDNVEFKRVEEGGR